MKPVTVFSGRRRQARAPRGAGVGTSAARVRLTLAGAAAALFVACAPASDRETAVRAVLAEAETAAEARDVGDAMDLVSPDFSGANGLDRDGLRSFLRGYFTLNPSLRLVVRIETLEFPESNLARVRLGVASLSRGRENAGAGAADGAASEGSDGGLDLDLGRFDVELVEEGGEWKLFRSKRVIPGV